ncbi:interferon-induced very large GTPase 1-like isoform X2 [Puntigrus tetrazona]|uniref:interferon-induced very large GTPase 1-like isoform X2 n=1 Tax=Puntigrus tetrazona TaxID=1606681 RepID=UPI001C89F293|nr:interferon-induced very large GTPase 1-like isoform X2 [Puntigrus tetrazona]
MEEGAGEQRTALQYTLQATWKQKLLTATIALTVAVVAFVVAMAGTTLSEAVVGAATGAAAGVGILQSLWEAELKTKAVAVAVTAVTGGLTGAIVAILRSLVGAQSLTASAVSGAIAGAAIIAISKAQVKWLINKIQKVINKLQWVLVLVKRVKAAVKWCKKVLPTAILSVGSGSAAIAAAALQAEKSASETLQAESAASKGASQAESAASDEASQAESAASAETSETESAAEPAASQAESAAPKENSHTEAASQAESAEKGGTSQTESTASQAESATSDGASQAESTASQAESAASDGASHAKLTASQADSPSSQAESATSDGASQVESTATGGTLQTETASQAESGKTSQAELASQAESAEKGGISQAESTVSDGASQADSGASGGTSPAESTASQAASDGASQVESTSTEGTLQTEAAPQAETAVPGTTSQAESSASKRTSLTKSATSQAKSAASRGASQTVSASASQGASLTTSAESGRASVGVSGTRGVASLGVSAASGGASLGVSGTTGVASLGVSAASGGASLGVSAASGGASLGVSAASGEASLGVSAASGGASLGVSAASGGASLGVSGVASLGVSAASGGASLGVSAASGGASLGVSAASGGASLGVLGTTRGASLGVSAASGEASLGVSAASGGASLGVSAASAGASLLRQRLREGLGFIAGAKSAIFGSHRQRQRKQGVQLATHTIIHESSQRGKSPKTDRSWDKNMMKKEQPLLMEESAASQVESEASKGTSQAASGGASQIEAAASLAKPVAMRQTSQTESASESVSSQAESSAAGKTSQAASGGTSQTKAAASQAESAATGGTSQAQSEASGGISQTKAAASQAEIAAARRNSQTESVEEQVAPQPEPTATGGSHNESTTLKGASQAESVATRGTSQIESTAEPVATGGTSQAKSTASQAESAAGGTSQIESTAEPAAAKTEAAEAASQAESALTGGTSQVASAAEPTALQSESEASGGASETESAASQAESGTSEAKSTASEAGSAATGGTSQEGPAAETAASQAESVATGGTSQTESSEGASQAESAASEVALQSETAAPRETSQTESAAEAAASQSELRAIQAESTSSDVASQAELATLEETSQTESAASQAELVETGVVLQAESVATGGTSQTESVAELVASQAELAEEALQVESAASRGTSQTQSVAEPAALQTEAAASHSESRVIQAESAEGASQAESGASDEALQSESATSGRTSETEPAEGASESAASEDALQSESATSGGTSETESTASKEALQSESATSGRTSETESAEGASESAASEDALQSESATSGGTSETESTASKEALQSESATSGRTSETESAEGASESAASEDALQSESATSGGTSETESTASEEALQSESATSGRTLETESAEGASQSESAASEDALQSESATSGGTSETESTALQVESVASEEPLQSESAASGTTSQTESAEGASQAESAASEDALQSESIALQAKSATSDGTSQAESAASEEASQAESAATGGTLHKESAASQTELAASEGASQEESGATLFSHELLGGLGLVAGATSVIFGSHRHRQLQKEAIDMLAAHTIIHESSHRDKSLQIDGSWDEKMIEKEQPLLMEDTTENAETCVPRRRISGQMTEDSIKRAIKDIGNTEIRPDQPLQQEKIQREEIRRLFHRLHLESKCHNKLRAADVLQITEHSLQCHESCAEGELSLNFLQKLLMMDYRARYINVDKASQQDHTQQRNTDLSEDSGDIFKAVSLSNKSQSDLIHPMDVQMAVFHCADGFLKQLMVTKLSQCQYALPLLVPDPFTQQIEFPLWTFRQVNKSWKMRNNNDEVISQTQSIYKTHTPMVFFFRFGSVSSSKSQLMNSLINEKHNTFFHRNCSGSSKTRVLMDGLVEIAWYCPSESHDDKFNDCLAFCNLHGDAGDHEKQMQILTEMSSVNVVLLPRLERNNKHAPKIQNLYMDRKPLICIFTEDECTVIEMKKGKFKIGSKDRSQLNVSDEIRRCIKDCLSDTSSTFRLEDVSKHSDIRVDEEEDDDCRRGREAAEEMISLLEKKDLTEIKELFLPHQGKLWHQWSQKNKELHRPQAKEKEIDISRKQSEIMNIRQQQNEFKISEFMEIFLKKMHLHAKNEMMFLLKWLRILLDEYISDDLSALYHKYDETWSANVKLNKIHDKSEQLKAEQTDLERISVELQAAAFGLEHIMREIGQIYESCSSVKENKKDLQVHFSSLPGFAAEMMISGSPLELMDGDAAHVPVIWVSAVLDQLVQKLGDQRVFVLSVLGIQSSGKSTMLNAMFGLQLAVSAGRCTRGAFMHLVRVSDEMKTQMNVDYILVVETKGLGALELTGKKTKDHDNDLATFVVGLGNLTLINIFGENPSEMQDILQIVVQAFMRMKKVRLNPSCVFVHQNISDVIAQQKNVETRRRLQQTLDEITKLAAKEEVYDAECFSDVIRFDVQKDVKYFVQFWEGSPPMAPPNPQYCKNIQELKKSILSHVSELHRTRLIDLKVCIKDLSEALLNEQFVCKFRTAQEFSAYRKFETEYNKWSWSLRRAMLETENKLHNKIDNEAIHEVEETDLQREIKETSEEVNKSMSVFFYKNKDEEIQIHWKTSFEIKIKELQENIIRKAKAKINEILLQQDLKKKIDAQRTLNENTLYKKSEELALKIKTKRNDEERLKKMFDLTWKQSVKKIIKDTPAIKDIDIMTDVREILSGIYGASADHWKRRRDVFFVMSYDDYVKIKKSRGFFTKAKEFDYALLKEHEIQTRAIVLDVAQQTDNMIQSFNISIMGYNIRYIQQLTDYIKKKIKHEEECIKCVFKKQFFIDLVYSICKRANEMMTNQQRMFKEANDPVIYTEKKREEYYSIFQKFCQGATLTAIFGEIICQKLKEPMEQSIYKKTARDLVDEIRSNCPSLNGNRSNLEKHILKTLAEEEDFDKYMNYIHNPRDHFKSFIRDEVSCYINDKFSVSVLPKMKENTELLHQKIMKAAHEATEHVQVNSGDVGLWLKSFTQQLSDELIFSEKDLSGVKHDDVDDLKLLDDVMTKELTTVMSEISSRFNTETFPGNLDYKFRPDEHLINHFCQCCWNQCPFCKAICTNTIEKHDGDHRVPFHRITGIAGLFYRGTRDLAVKICTSAVANRNQYFYPNTSDDCLPCTEYRKAGGVLADWSITPDFSDLPYWKWFVCRFQGDLEKYYNKTFVSNEIPDNWRKYSKQEAIESSDQYI